MYRQTRYGAIDVYYRPELDGGGSTFGQDYVRFVRSHVGPVGRVFEWCAGPGFIGFSLLAHGLCDSLCLADINPLAIEACRETIRVNGLEDKVSVYLSDGLRDLPPDERWDLVVANPPFSGTDRLFPRWGDPILYRDTAWRTHRDFYAGVRAHLEPGASVVIQECVALSGTETFRSMIEDGGLRMRGIHPAGIEEAPAIYYLWSEPVPA